MPDNLTILGALEKSPDFQSLPALKPIPSQKAFAKNDSPLPWQTVDFSHPGAIELIPIGFLGICLHQKGKF